MAAQSGRRSVFGRMAEVPGFAHVVCLAGVPGLERRGIVHRRYLSAQSCR